MLKINDTFYQEADFKEQYQRFSKLSFFNETGTIKIAVCLEDTFTWLSLCFFARKMGISIMPIHPSTPSKTAEKLASKAQCKVLYYRNLDTFTKINTDNAKSIDEPGLIQMSSGTTGEPKCICRDWRSIDDEVTSYINAFKKADNMTPIIACPVTHSYGLISGVMVALSRGQVPIIVTTINPKYLIKVVRNCHQPLLYSSPTMLQNLISLWPKQEKLHAIMTSGTTLSTQAFEALSSHATHIFQQYGCSEVGCISINQNMTAANDIGTPLSHIEILHNHDENKIQEIIVSKKTETEKTTPLIHTQDLGVFKENALDQLSLHFVSRMDDTIIVSGLNVYPIEVEDIILTHPKVNDAVIFKVEDPYSGQRVALQYISHEKLSEKSLRNWCISQLAAYQVPIDIICVENIERLPNGKVNRKYLAIKYEELKRVPVQKNQNSIKIATI